MTAVEKSLLEIVEQRLGRQAAQTARVLMEAGITDAVRCRALVVKEYVARQERLGTAKVEAMYMAASRFCCSYESVRNYVYNYKDILLIPNGTN